MSDFIPIVVVVENGYLKIRIHGVLHLRLPYDEIKSVQGYVDSGTARYRIQYIVSSSPTVTESWYERKDWWQFILQELDKLHF